MASSSSSSQERSISFPKLYDAFISHRGPDVKDTLAKQLYNLLKAKECRAFLDREEIEGGDSIPAAIRNGISSSAVQIAIFSKGYAESSWCLDELVLMLEQIDKGAMFIPVFYNVKPWELRYMENDNSQYAAAFSYYQSKGRNLGRLDAWKKALESAANISGYEHSQPQGDCKDLCEKIVSRVVQEMQKRIPLHVAKYPIALNELVHDFEMSCPQTEGLVGILGLGGSGKTTLAKELFNRKRERYGASSFLSDVRESHANRQLHSLQNQLMKDIFDEKSEFKHVDEGTTRLKYRLARANDYKFLIVLDDIDRHNQLDALLPEPQGILSSGSLVIITTRYGSVLMAADVTFRYKMKPLHGDHAKELFSSHALLTRDPPIAYEKMVDGFIEYCRGLPLALIVLGAHVRGKGERFWELELEKVGEVPPEEIMQSLKISFDGLNKVEQQIFIDIACFFNKRKFVGIPQRDSSTERAGISVDDPPKIYIRASQRDISCGEIEPISIWKTSGWSAEHAVQTLQQKCLLEVVRDKYCFWRFEMHDHLRDLGRQMTDELGPPRLWKPDILRSMEAKGFKHVLDSTKARCFNSFRDSSLDTTITYFTGKLNDSADIELLWLAINEGGGGLGEIPSWIPLQKLHFLFVRNMEVSNSFHQQMQTDSQGSFELRRLHIRGWYKFQKLPELGQLERLTTLELRFCYKLETVPVLSSLKGLQSLHVKCCYKLKTISDLSSLTGLQSLHVRQCDRLKTISGISALTGLQSLHIQRCGDLETVFSLSSLTELRSLHMQGYLSIDRLKHEIMLSEEFNVANMRNLERNAILGCHGKLQRVQGFQELQRLKHLTIEVPENGYAWVRNCVHALRRLPSACTVLIGNAVEKAMDRLNVDLFSEVMDSPTIHEIDREADEVPMSRTLSAITIYALLCECGEIEVSAELQTPYRYNFMSAAGLAGLVMFTVVLPPRSQFEFMLECRKVCLRGRVGKGVKATLNEGQEGKALTLFQTLVDRLYGESSVQKLAAKRKRERN